MTNKGVATCLEGTRRFLVCAQVTSLADAKHWIGECPWKSLPGLVVMDIILGNENGLDFIPFLEGFCRENNLTKPAVLVCSMLEELFRIQCAINLGALGYVSKSDGEAELLAAIDAVLQGRVYLAGRHSDNVARNPGLFEKLSRRERRIFDLIQRNRTNQEIADELCLDIRTVQNHVSNIYFKTRTRNRQELMRL